MCAVTFILPFIFPSLNSSVRGNPALSSTWKYKLRLVKNLCYDKCLKVCFDNICKWLAFTIVTQDVITACFLSTTCGENC